MRKLNGICCRVGISAVVCISLLAGLIAGWFQNASASDDAICAVVKIQIRQELTLERQAFDAHMKINNGLSHLPLENVNVTISFADENGDTILATNDPENMEAAFFIRDDSEAASINSDGSWDIDPVEPASSTDINWLIIPAPGSAGEQKDGTMYYVGAKLTYTLGGETHTTTVTPDYIFVKPLPQIVLDYFLTEAVYGDDAWTEEIEPPVPFTLGVRVQNTGRNTAHNLRIDSAQPEIVENEQGLLIDFAIEGAQVNGEPVGKSLLADFGDIEAGRAKVGRWIMTCTLSGRFIDFDATVSHADELGGELTSLIRQEDVQTHFLVHDVLVDLPGRDNVHDFLARDQGVLTVFESSGEDTAVADQSADSVMTLAGQSGSRYSYDTVTPDFSNTTDTPGFIYFKRPDPHGGNLALHGATRSDGKTIHPANAWLSKERKENPKDGWNHFVNLFDADTTGAYTLVFDEPAQGDEPPELLFIPDKTLAEKQYLSFIVEASTPGTGIPALFVSGLPALASFEDRGDGNGIFEWTPAPGQAGTYRLVFGASDGHQEDRQAMTITVYPEWDMDGDGMADEWETTHFGHTDRDGTGDYDGDGISDIDEYLLGTDPATPHHAPTIPVIAAPADKTVVDSLSPALTIENSWNSGRNIIDQAYNDRDINEDEIFYEFELYADAAFLNPVEKALNVAAGDTTTSWQAQAALSDDTWYYWRVRATDGAACSLWAYGSFFVSTENNPLDDSSINGQTALPSHPVIKNPGKGAWVGIRTPKLAVHPAAQDTADEPVTYIFEICKDEDCETRVLHHETENPALVLPLELDNNTRYYWRILSADSYGETAGWSESALFFVRQTRPLPEITGRPPTIAVAGAPYSFTPSGESADPEDTLLFAVANKPEWAQFDKTSGKLHGSPSKDHAGTTFTDTRITVTDGVGAFASLAPFDIMVVDDTYNPPVAVADAYTTPENMPLEIDAPGVLENDLPGDDGEIRYARLLAPPSHGYLSFNEDGSFIHMPFDGYTGEDSFTYAANDGNMDSGAGVVSINVTPVSTGPEISAIDDAVIVENTAISGIAFTISDPEAAAEDIVLHAFSDNTDLVPDENILIDGSGENRTITIIPAKNRHGMAVITVTATGPEGESSSILFTAEVAPKNNPPNVRYFLLNPELLDALIHVTSLSDGNHITAGETVLKLDRYKSGAIDPENLVQGDVVSGTGHFAISSSAPGSNMPVPESFAAMNFVIPHVRGIHTYTIASPYGDSSVAIHTGDDRVAHISIARGDVHTFSAGRNNATSAVVTSDLPVLISHEASATMGCDDYPMDAYPVPPASREVWGIRGRDTHIGALHDDTTVTVTYINGAQEIHEFNAGAVMPLSWLPHPRITGKAVHLAADKPIAAVQTDGVRGSAATALLSTDYHAARYAVPVNAQSITAVCRYPETTITLYNGSRLPVKKICSSTGESPGSVRFDSSDHGKIPAGSYLEASDPFYMIFEADCGFRTERNLLGAD